MPGIDYKEVLQDLEVRISSAVARQDTEHPVFHGCWDWHSSVHGHWALLRIARAVDLTKGREADAALTVEGIAKEAAFFRENPYFEMPYGRAWFLRLAMEHELWSRESDLKDPLRLRTMADEMAASLLGYYGEFPPTPSSREYNDASWALAQLHDYFKHTGDSKGAARVRAHVRERFLGPAMGFEPDAGVPEFFSPFGNRVYLLSKTLDAKAFRSFLKRHPIRNGDLAPVKKFIPYPHRPSKEYRPAAHHFGMNWSRAWALRALSRSDLTGPERLRFERAFREHVVEGLRQHKIHADDYGTYGHWVPQFAVYALTEGYF